MHMKRLPKYLPTPQSLLEYLTLPAQDKYNHINVANSAQLCCTFTLHTLMSYNRN